MFNDRVKGFIANWLTPAAIWLALGWWLVPLIYAAGWIWAACTGRLRRGVLTLNRKEI